MSARVPEGGAGLLRQIGRLAEGADAPAPGQAGPRGATPRTEFDQHATPDPAADLVGSLGGLLRGSGLEHVTKVPSRVREDAAKGVIRGVEEEVQAGSRYLGSLVGGRVRRVELPAPDMPRRQAIRELRELDQELGERIATLKSTDATGRIETLGSRAPTGDGGLGGLAAAVSRVVGRQEEGAIESTLADRTAVRAALRERLDDEVSQAGRLAGHFERRLASAQRRGAVSDRIGQTPDDLGDQLTYWSERLQEARQTLTGLQTSTD